MSNRPTKSIDTAKAMRSAYRGMTPEKARAYRELANTHRNRVVPFKKSN